MIEKGRVLVIDVDGTLCSKAEVDGDYLTTKPDVDFVKKLLEYRNMGFYIVLNTSRQMRTYEGNIGKINANTLPTLIEWLTMHDIPYDEIHVGKPWCGNEGFYIDDRAIRPKEFLHNSYDEIMTILKRDKNI